MLKLRFESEFKKEKNALVIEISDQGFEQEVLKSDLPVVVGFGLLGAARVT